VPTCIKQEMERS